MPAHEGENHIVPYRLYVNIWLALVVLTAVTVGVSYVDMKHVTVTVAMLIAACKSALVVLYFMHIRFEKPIFALMIMAVLGTYAIFIGLTFADYLFR